MISLAIAFPAIEPEIFRIGPFALRWYALAYIAGIVIGWRLALRLADRAPRVATRGDIDDFVTWATLGVILGGRLGYVIFYKPAHFLANPGDILAVWQGGMSFHGGMLGAAAATALFARRRGIDMLALGDVVAQMAPIGLFFGRIANFINAELYGRPTDVAWAVVFPTDPLRLGRHPSQLYEAVLEGAVLFVVLALLAARSRARWRPGTMAGAFLIGYGVARIVCEFFREPDAHLGFLHAGATMGQVLSLPMLLAGAFLVLRARQRPPIADAADG
jgi:phosphatidylglycerol:prolipoprotein diacylglycerol transferase